eukprot:TRINITY_DN2172_c0_g1_i1.p1 TRINITY_DN2172_c0_g1~~TRINITY_DN2172_c0_g1_i1.p1  ORF type:complete len:739 (+),score=375.75 TRINITY_DN2172_c0_g1_i1:77-2218(+)
MANKQEFFLRFLILALIYAIAFFTRLFSVLRFESVIHEFDPYFNYRSTQYLVNEGFYNFINWFDSGAWYPLGRIVGGTVYPGIMVTAAAVYWVLHFFNFTIQIRNVCVLLAPWFASNTSLITYFLTKEAFNTTAGVVAAAFVAIVPGYISRSVAGSFDNEGIAIFALINTYFFWVKAVKTGSMAWAAGAALAYFYMVAAWGGYVFIINLIPLHVIVLLFSGRLTGRVYVAYSTFYVIATLLAMQISFVGFQPVQSAEHMGALATFALLQVYYGIFWLRSHISDKEFQYVFRLALLAATAVFGAIVVVGSFSGYFSKFTGRFYALLDPTYAKQHIPIIASVSEHQPTTWASFFFDLHILVFFFPVGLYYCFRNLTDANIFLILYGVTSVYFSGVMVRLILILAPISCVLGAIGFSESLKTYMRLAKGQPAHLAAPLTTVSGATVTVASSSTSSGPSPSSRSKPVSADQKSFAFGMVAILIVVSLFYAYHCTWVTSEAYSSPSIVLAARHPDGSKTIFDDFREAYYWLRHNTREDARIMSWWDYGYQLAAMANRTILVDNNTWNNSHIAEVGRAMAFTEDNAIKIVRQLDVDYVLIIFGGLIGYSSDDINKFLWMVRIGGSTDPSIKEATYFTKKGEYSMGPEAPPAMLNSVMYKLSYYRFADIGVDPRTPRGFDRVRNIEIGQKDIHLKYFEEVYTTEHWLVRLYKVKDLDNRA